MNSDQEQPNRRSQPLLLIGVVYMSLLICGCLPLMIYVNVTDPNYPCFRTFTPSWQRVAEQSHISLPPSTTNFEWQCDAGIAIYVRFNITPEDVEYITDDPKYYSMGSSEDFLGALSRFSVNSDGNSSNNSKIEHYTTWQGNADCGWINIVIDMDNPELYTIYATYYSWNNCESFYWF